MKLKQIAYAREADRKGAAERRRASGHRFARSFQYHHPLPDRSDKKLKATNYDLIKEIEGQTLKTFQEEIPSIYFSDKTEKEYLEYRNSAEHVYRDLFKFPPKMFDGAKLIDFGAGTGENTVYLASWGAS